MAWAEGLPGSVWVFYPALLIVLILIVNGIAWLVGVQPIGTLDVYRSSLPVYPIAVLALIHYLNQVARRALAVFRPALGASDSEETRVQYELTTLPARGTRVVLLLSLVFTLAFTLFMPGIDTQLRRAPGLVAVDSVIYVITFGLVAVLVYHTIRQLRMVSRIHASAKNVNLFQLTPLYAFSGLTARTGIGLLLLNTFSILTDPTTFVNPALIGLTIFTSLSALACFFLPLKGMHDRITFEKKRLLAEANARLETTIREVYRRADNLNLAQVDQLDHLMASLVTTREVLSKISTWPWETRTLTGFLTAFLLPLIVGLLAKLLERFVF
jgi:hypothetical protein